MTIAKVVLAGVCVALVGGVLVLFWKHILIVSALLQFVYWVVSEAKKPPVAINREEQERQRRSFFNYQIAQDMAERREVYREAQAQWRQQQQPPPRDPSTWGGGDGGRFC